MLELEHLTRDGAFSDVSLSVRSGEVAVLVERNGSRMEIQEATLAGVWRVRAFDAGAKFARINYLIARDLADAGAPTLIRQDEKSPALYVLMPMRV